MNTTGQEKSFEDLQLQGKGPRIVIAKSRNYDSPLAVRVSAKILGEQTTCLMTDISRTCSSQIAKIITPSSNDGTLDIVTLLIANHMWHLVDKIFQNLDAYSLENCEKVTDLWSWYIINRDVWKKNVTVAAKDLSKLVSQNGWSKFLDDVNDKKIQLRQYKHTYWKMTNLPEVWTVAHRGTSVIKNHFQRPGSMTWKFLESQRAVSVYNTTNGFVLKIHDQQTYRFCGSTYVYDDFVTKDTLCLDADDNHVIVGGMLSHKLWIFQIDEVKEKRTGKLSNFMARGSGSTMLNLSVSNTLDTGAGVIQVQICPSDGNKFAVLLPVLQVLEIWNLRSNTRLHTLDVTSDSCYLMWQRCGTIVVAPLYSGVILSFEAATGKPLPSVTGDIRRIDAIAVHENLCTTAETQEVKVWSLQTGRCFVRWTATKSFITAVAMNDVLVMTGSHAGIVKLWDLKVLLKNSTSIITPLRRITMKGLLHYPIKSIFPTSYTELAIVAKYEGNNKKDKVKIFEVYSRK